MLLLIMQANLLYKTPTEGPSPPVAGITRGVKEPCSMSVIRFSYCLLLSFSFFLYVDWMVWLAWDGANGLNTLTSKNAHCLSFLQSPWQGLSHLVLHCLPNLWFGVGKFLRIGVEGVVQPQHSGTLW